MRPSLSGTRRDETHRKLVVRAGVRIGHRPPDAGDAGGVTVTKADLVHVATKADLQQVRADLYSVILLQTGVLLATIFAMLRFLG